MRMQALQVFGAKESPRGNCSSSSGKKLESFEMNDWQAHDSRI